MASALELGQARTPRRRAGRRWPGYHRARAAASRRRNAPERSTTRAPAASRLRRDLRGRGLGQREEHDVRRRASTAATSSGEPRHPRCAPAPAAAAACWSPATRSPASATRAGWRASRRHQLLSGIAGRPAMTARIGIRPAAAHARRSITGSLPDATLCVEKNTYTIRLRLSTRAPGRLAASPMYTDSSGRISIFHAIQHHEATPSHGHPPDRRARARPQPGGAAAAAARPRLRRDAGDTLARHQGARAGQARRRTARIKPAGAGRPPARRRGRARLSRALGEYLAGAEPCSSWSCLKTGPGQAQLLGAGPGPRAACRTSSAPLPATTRFWSWPATCAQRAHGRRSERLDQAGRRSGGALRWAPACCRGRRLCERISTSQAAAGFAIALIAQRCYVTTSLVWPLRCRSRSRGVRFRRVVSLRSSAVRRRRDRQPGVGGGAGRLRRADAGDARRDSRGADRDPGAGPPRSRRG